MKPYLRAIFSRVALTMIAGMLSVCEVAWAQSQQKPADATETQKKSGPKKPTRNTGWVTTNDPVALMTVRRAPRMIEASAEESAKLEPAAAKEAVGTPEEVARKNAEIAALEKQIQDKQKRIALLMRLFVRDERPFLNDPAGAAADAAAQERRKYEQDELLYESAEIAQLREKQSALKSANREIIAAEKP